MVRPDAHYVPVPAARRTGQRVEAVLLLHTVRAKATSPAAKEITVSIRALKRQTERPAGTKMRSPFQTGYTLGLRDN